MQYSELVNILDKTELSPEQLAPILGVSNMTVRRWKKERPNKTVSKAYERLLLEGIQQMLSDGTLPPDSAWAQELLASSPSFSIAAALNGMGVTQKDLSKDGSQSEKLIGFLQFIGFSAKHRAAVDGKKTEISSFKRMGGEWKKSLSVLLNVIRSKKLTSMDKLIAYGALFYLLCPLDLIPDQIPVFGYVDDLALITLAAGYYLNHKIGAGDGGENESTHT